MMNHMDASSLAGRTPKFVVEVLYNFFPSDKQHLTLTQYEKVKVIETHESNWWIGERANGEVGLFPANYVRRVQDITEESPRHKEKTFQKPVSYDPNKNKKTKEEQLQKRKQLASQLGLGGLDLDDLLSEDEDDVLSSEDEQEKPPQPTTLTKQSSTASLKSQPSLPSQQVTTTINPQNAAGKFVTEEAYEKKKKELQEALQKQLEDQKTKTIQAEEIQKLKEELQKAKAEVDEARKVTTPRTTPRGGATTTTASQSVVDLDKKQKELERDFEKKKKDLEKEFEKKQREADQELEKKKREMEKEIDKQAEKKQKDFIKEAEKQNSASSEMQKTIEKLKQKNTQLEEKVVTLDKSIVDMKQKHTKELKEAADKLKEQKEGSLKHAQLKIVRMKKQIQAVKLENEYLKVETQEMQKEFLASLHKISSTGLKKLMDGYKDLEEKYKKELKERRLLYNQLQDLKGNIRVNLRVRPLLPEDGQTENCIECVDDKEVKVYDKEAKKSYKFEFDSVFGIDSTQAQVFEDVKPLATSILDGYNVCIFAYGQTGSGKTFTMEGPPNNRGVNYNTLDEVFFMIKERKGEYSYEVEVAVMEIYNENLHDLLTKDKTKLEIMLSNKVSVPGLTRIKVNSSDDVRKVLSQGYENRATGSNNINAHSSRSHCIVSVFVEGVNLYTQQKLSGKLHLIDLAGSERLKRTDVKGDRLKEAQSINKSLSALGDVISALSSKKGHIPYRNSKLTSLLQDSLGGNSKMLMFVNVSPTVESCPETLCSLGFAQRARTVELGKAQKNIVSQGTASTSGSNSNN